MNGRLLAFCFLAACASVAAAQENRFDVHLIEPADHAAVPAGSTVSIAWDAAGAPQDVDEWEAFVSIDGGATYPIRITPHLDVHIRRFAWTVPFLPGSELSFLLRFGNEQEERLFSFPRRVTVRGAEPLETVRLRRCSAGSNRNRDHGVTLIDWVDGTRQGANLERVVFDPSSLTGDATWSHAADEHDNAAMRDGPQRTIRTSDGPSGRLAESRVHRPRRPQAEPIDVLTRTHRLNT